MFGIEQGDNATTWSEKFSVDVIKSTGMTSCKVPNDRTYMVKSSSMGRINHCSSRLDLRGYCNKFIWSNKNRHIFSIGCDHQSIDSMLNERYLIILEYLLLQIQLEVVETVSDKEQDQWGPVNIEEVHFIIFHWIDFHCDDLDHSILAT